MLYASKERTNKEKYNTYARIDQNVLTCSQLTPPLQRSMSMVPRRQRSRATQRSSPAKKKAFQRSSARPVRKKKQRSNASVRRVHFAPLPTSHRRSRCIGSQHQHVGGGRSRGEFTSLTNSFSRLERSPHLQHNRHSAATNHGHGHRECPQGSPCRHPGARVSLS